MSVTDMAVDANGILYRLHWLNLLESVEVRTGEVERTHRICLDQAMDLS